MFKCCGKKTKISPMECLQDDEIMKKIIEYTISKPNFFKGNEIQNIKSSFRNSFSFVRKVANFPCREAREIYTRYFNEKQYPINCLDTSCGFGSRMSAVLLSGNNYYGIDPNKTLQNKLFECAKWYKDNGFINDNQVCQLVCDGSENFIKEWENIIDVMFTSPPYFNLEKYSNDNSQSTKNYDNYNNWVNGFVKPTVENIYKYLKFDGYAIINIKNISKKQTCYDDFYKSFIENGFKYIETFDLKITKKNYGMASGVSEINNIEPVMVFKKVNRFKIQKRVVDKLLFLCYNRIK